MDFGNLKKMEVLDAFLCYMSQYWVSTAGVLERLQELFKFTAYKRGDYEAKNECDECNKVSEFITF